jgi:DNA repair exonuclease SbcCD ATPase subunit
MLDMLQAMPDANLPEATVPHEEEVLAQRQQAIAQANADLQLAEAQLAQAQQERQFQEYQHSLEMSKRAIAIEQARLQRQEQLQNQQEQEQQRSYQLAEIQVQMQALETQLAQLSAVRSPYSGVIQRIKYEGQNDQALTVELTLVVSGSTSRTSPE